MRYQDVVYSRIRVTCISSRIEIDASDCDDICAEVFAVLLARDMSCLKRFRGDSSIATWISVIAKRVCLRQLQKISRSITKPVNNIEKETGAEESHVSQLILKEEISHLWINVKKLGYGDQQVLNMYFREELSYAEISQRMGISVNTVGPKLHRAQKRLKKLMEH